MKRLILLLFLSVFLSACAAKLTLGERFGPQCEEIGFQIESDEHRNCVLMLYQADIQRRQTMIQAGILLQGIGKK